MKKNLSPHWTSTGSPQEEMPLSAELGVAHSNATIPVQAESTRIPVRGGMPKGIAVTIGITLSVSGASFLGYLFLEGVGSLQANITGEMVPDHIIELSERGFSDVSVSVGELLEFKNTLATVEQYRSEIPNEKTGMPLMATPTIPPGNTVRLRVPSEAAGRDVLLISGFDPSRRGMMRVGVGAGSFSSSEGDRVEKQEKEKEEEMDIPLPMLSQKPSSSSSSSASSTSPAAVHPVAPKPAASPMPAQFVVAPSTPPQNVQPEVLNLGTNTAAKNMAAVWPSYLRTNRYTIGSPYVPDLSPIVAVRFGGTPRNAARDQMKAGALNGVHHAPDTGPSLWVLVVLSLCVLPVYLVKRVR